MAVTETEAKKKILIISHDKIGSSMAGPGIRYHHMGQMLSANFDVTIAFFDPSYLPDDEFKRSYKVKPIDARLIGEDFGGYDIVISLWLSPRMISYCNTHNIFLVFDLYAPVPVESLASSIFSGKKIKNDVDFEFTRSLVMYRLFLENGDLFLCSNQRQVDFWLGYAFGSDQVRPSEYVKRSIYSRFLYAPMGIDAKTKLSHKQTVMREVMPGIKKTDKILLWTGGIWGHFDGQVLIRAMKRLKKSHPEIKLVFFGTQHPNPSVPEMQESFDTRNLAKELGVLDKTVFFKDGWVPYSKRLDYLLEADVAVNTHKDSIETEFAHRTRVLDHLLAGLPTVTTEGDYFADEVITPKNLGLSVPANDEEALEKAILEILKPDRYKAIKANIKAERTAFDWDNTLGELSEFLLSNPTKLPHTKLTHKLKDDTGLVLFAKRVLPASAKKVIIRAIRYSS
jgi:glycosyltransferase involved in cell wall biosynthesis